MLGLIPLSLWTIVLYWLRPAVLGSAVLPLEDVELVEQSARGLHLSIQRRVTRRSTRIGRRDLAPGAGAIGLGDYADVTYSVLIQVGETETPLVLDTGSADLWVISDTCTSSCNNTGYDIPLYPLLGFQPVEGLEAQLFYGDSQTGTHAYGPIGTDSVGLAGLSMSDQYFVAVNDTNTDVLASGCAGIFGLGFPVSSVIWSDLFSSQHPNLLSRELPPSHTQEMDSSHKLSDLATRFFPDFTFGRTSSSSNPSSKSPPAGIVSRQSSNSVATPVILSSFPTNGPLVSRLVSTAALSVPMFFITLQRDTVDIGGNAGVLSIGALPAGVANASLTWAPVRGYPPSQGGLEPPSNAPNEVYPIAWEIPIDDVYFDGQKLPRSTLSSPNISLSALVDSGNSLIRGPSDVVQHIQSALGPNGQFPCSSAHTLAFEVGGTLFPVDPRDFATQVYGGSVATCAANLAATDTPHEGQGYLYSWSLGDPFLKSVLAAFYYGNLTYPSRDPPRIGLLSTVPSNAGNLMQAAVANASSSGGNFPLASQSAPSGIFVASATGQGGVPIAQPTTGSTSGSSRSSGAAATRRTPLQWLMLASLTYLAY